MFYGNDSTIELQTERTDIVSGLQKFKLQSNGAFILNEGASSMKVYVMFHSNSFSIILVHCLELQ